MPSDHNYLTARHQAKNVLLCVHVQLFVKAKGLHMYYTEFIYSIKDA